MGIGIISGREEALPEKFVSLSLLLSVAVVTALAIVLLYIYFFPALLFFYPFYFFALTHALPYYSFRTRSISHGINLWLIALFIVWIILIKLGFNLYIL